MRALRAVADGGSYFCSVASAAIVKNYKRPARFAAEPPHTGVTRRERDVWKLTAEGLRVKEIAGRLSIGVKTVETHRAQLLKKLNCTGTAELTRRAIKEGLCPL
jgi:DNA-binding NarL/FixJ family response regulator